MLERFLVVRSLFLVVLAGLGLVVGGCGCGDCDTDGDGFCEDEGDCAEGDETIHPGAAEICDGIDQDCDTLVDEDFDSDLDQHLDDVACASGTDCDDAAADVNPDQEEVCDEVDHDCDGVVDNGLPEVEWCEDNDGDGVGSEVLITVCDETAPIGYVACSDTPDCDDADGTSYPGAIEQCDEVDHDCDGDPMNGLTTYQYWEDMDADGFGTGDTITDCDATPPAGFVEVDAAAEDCNDLDATTHPGAAEVCDALDHDCDAEPWNGLTLYEYWVDVDVDGYGTGVVVEDCESTPPAGHVAYDVAAEDCDDAAVGVNPGAAEVCNLVDDNCDTVTDEGFDVDTDGVSTCGPDGIAGNADDDCDDTEITTNPGAPELCDGVDNDCDTQVDEDTDTDGDTYTPCGADGIGGTPDDDCDDTNPATYPGATEICDGEDNSCDGNIPADETDVDGDGSPGCIDCDDDNPAISPDVVEVCDGLDTDCDLTIPADETDGDTDGYIPCTGYVANGAVGVLGGGDCADADPVINPAAVEICDLIDQDCDTLIDEDFDGDLDGVTTCGPDGIDANADDDCLDTDDTVFPGAAEICDGADNDCDGLVDAADDGFTGADADGDGDNAPFCGGADCDDTDPLLNTRDLDNDGQSTCVGDCDDESPLVNPAAVESCDGVDNDCDGDVDVNNLVNDADGDGFDTDGCSVGGTDCDDNDKHVFPDAIYTSGVVPACEPAVYPGFFQEWDYARISLPSYFFDVDTSTHYIYYRGHHDRPAQQIGVAWSPDGVTWTKEELPVLSPLNPDFGGAGWDYRNLSNPTVAKLPSTFARQYVMLYHAQDELNNALRQIGLATATDPLGPFERLDPLSGNAVTAPVLPPSADTNFLDGNRTLHPAIHWDGTELHVWYNGRGNSDSTLRIFHAVSADGGVTWTRSDVDSNGPDVIYEPSMSPIATTRTDLVSLIEDPFTVGEFEFWYGSDEVEVGATHGTATVWDAGVSTPVLTAAADCTRMDGGAVSARGINYDMAADVYHWYYGGQTDIEPMTGTCGDDPCAGTCAGNEDPIYVWLNGGYTASYVAQGTNWAPEVTINAPAAPAATMTLDGTVTDTAPDMVVVAISSDIDGGLGAATVAATGNSLQTVQTTTWTYDATLSSGTHTIGVKAVDEAGVERSTSITVVVP